MLFKVSLYIFRERERERKINNYFNLKLRILTENATKIQKIWRGNLGRRNYRQLLEVYIKLKINQFYVN